MMRIDRTYKRTDELTGLVSLTSSVGSAGAASVAAGVSAGTSGAGAGVSVCNQGKQDPNMSRMRWHGDDNESTYLCLGLFLGLLLGFLLEKSTR